MDASKVEMYLMTNQKMFPSEKMMVIKEKLLAMDENKWDNLSFLKFKDPTTALILSLFLGSYGVDRFYLGDSGLGVGKLLTCGGCGIWAIVDWFMIQDACREKNFEKLMQTL